MQTTHIIASLAGQSHLSDSKHPRAHTLMPAIPGPRAAKIAGGYAALLLVCALAVPAQAAPLSYNFDDGTLQGWTTVSSDPGNSPDPQNYASVSARDGISPQAGTKFVMCDPSGNRDSAHKPLWIRSPQFVINQAGTLTLYLAGGTSKGGYPGTSGPFPPKHPRFLSVLTPPSTA